MIVIVSGSRHWKDYNIFSYHLDRVIQKFVGREVLLCVGDCPTGADAMARSYAADRELECVVFQANWTDYGKAAGPLRNDCMVDMGLSLADDPTHLNLVIAVTYPMAGSKGTADLTQRARKANIMVYEVGSLPTYDVMRIHKK